MNKQDFLKIQTCVLKVNIHCEGCKHKVKKILQKIDGVYTTSVDSEQGKVTVTGNADPATLIKKLEKSGKHAELWGGKPIMDNFKVAGGKDAKSAKGGGGHAQEPLKGGGGGGGGVNNQQAMLLLQQKLQQMNGAKQMMGNPKDQKPVKFSMPEDEFDDESGDDEDDDYDDEDDEGYDSEFDDEDEDEDDDDDDDELEHHMPMPIMPNKNNNKIAPNMIGGGKGHGGGPMDAIMNGHAMINDNKGGKEGGGGGMAVDLPMVMKSKGGGDTDWDGKKGGGKEKDKSSKGLFGFLGAANKKSKDSNSNSKGFKDGGGKDKGKGGGDDNWSKKGGGKTHHDMNKMKNESHEIQVKAKQSKGGNGNDNDNDNGGKMGKGEMYESIPIPAVQGLPAPINGGYHPYNQQQQQYMAMMMNHHQQQQQRPYGNEMYQPMMYSRPPPSVSYGQPMPPPVPVDPYPTYFSDDNTNSCAVM